MFSKQKLIFLTRKNTIRRCYSKNISNKKWQSVIGVEVHAQISSNSKLFSGASTKFSSPINKNVSLFDAAIPGTLPVLNKRCVEAGILTALALNCRVNPVSHFDRKHYFYPDLPAGYQITQQRAPLANDGALEFQVFVPGVHKKPYGCNARIKQLQLEQDSGKTLHDDDRVLIDLNRAGIPLMELVFEPDLKDGEEAAALVKELIIILQRINTCSCKMEEGALRVDANVSINKEGESLGTRTEIKNIGSVRGVASAIQYEIERQIKIKESGGDILNETRGWDADSKSTISMRDKEVVQDYRYMPEPNLPPLHVSINGVNNGCINVDELKLKIPELPAETRQRLQHEFSLTSEQSIILVNDNELLNIFEHSIKNWKISGKSMANFLINELNSLLNKRNLNVADIKCDKDFFGKIVNMLETKHINRPTAKLLIDEIIINGNHSDPLKIVEENNWQQITDEEQLRKICLEVINTDSKIVKDFKSGKSKAFKALLGSVYTKSENRADMAKCDIILKELLTKK